MEQRWSLDDLYDAHEFLDLYDRAEAREANRIRDETHHPHRSDL